MKYSTRLPIPAGSEGSLFRLLPEFSVCEYLWVPWFWVWLWVTSCELPRFQRDFSCAPTGFICELRFVSWNSMKQSPESIEQSPYYKGFLFRYSTTFISNAFQKSKGATQFRDLFEVVSRRYNHWNWLTNRVLTDKRKDLTIQPADNRRLNAKWITLPFIRQRQSSPPPLKNGIFDRGGKLMGILT